MKPLMLLLAAVAHTQELTEQQREEERRRLKQQQEVASQQLNQARQTATGVEGAVLHQGVAPPDRVMVSLVCGEQTVEKRLTDSKGSFSFSFAPSAGGADASAGRPQMITAACFVHAALAGFTSEPVRIENVFAGSGPLRVRLSLRQLESAGLTYSATTMAASPAARKAYEKGQKALDSRKLAEAEPELRRAVELHPRYAIAWYALGRVYLSTGRAAEARQAFDQAVAADAKYFNPYPQLVQLDLQERKWEELSRHAQTAIQLNPLYSASIYLLSAQANFQLKRMDIAEKHAREAVRMDTQRKWPVALRLLGAILAAQGRNAEAAVQYRAFLETGPAPADSAAIRAEIEKLERP